MNVENDGLLTEFITECREHLADIENDMLAIEQQGANINDELVNKVFRAAHSIKGGSGFFNLPKIQELAHKTENALQLVRSREMVPSPEVVNILLMAFDKLRELINDVDHSNEADIAEFIVSLTGLTASYLPADQKKSVSEQKTIPVPDRPMGLTASVFDLERARKAGQHIYVLQYDLIHDVQRRNRTPLDIIKNLTACGSILNGVLDISSAGTLDDSPSNKLMFDVLYATVIDPTIIRALAEVPEAQVKFIEHPETLAVTPSTAPPAAAEAPVAAPAAPLAAKPPHEAPAEAAAEAAGKGGAGETTLRVNVTLLESLMNLAGELVLSRNQLSDALARNDPNAVKASSQRINLVTSDLQEAVMQTRMQPIANLFNKFPRVVRDLSHKLGKNVQLEVEGKEVELDKTLLEGLNDPLTHMVRNSVDHGVELPDARVARGKKPMGTVHLKAYHQAGQVVIEVADDGKGIDPEKVAAAAVAKGLLTREQVQAMKDHEKTMLIFLPGLSTAENVTDVSGRGVGLDVVKTNVDKLGGQVEIDSVMGRGTTFRIKVPLTLAIIPSLLVSVRGEPFALPQVNVHELLRLKPEQAKEKIKVVSGVKVLILRDTLIPLVSLEEVLGVPAADDARAATSIVVVNSGAFEYGIVVEKLHDTVEIVVKPLGNHLKGLREYAGATILGDGRVAVILDVAGFAARAGIAAKARAVAQKETAGEAAKEAVQGAHSFLFFHDARDLPCAVPLELVTRIEPITRAQIESVGGRRTMQYRGASLPLLTLEDAEASGEFDGFALHLAEMLFSRDIGGDDPGTVERARNAYRERMTSLKSGVTAECADFAVDKELVVIVFEVCGRPIGLLVAKPLDVLETDAAIDRTTLKRHGIMGSAIVKGRTTRIVDIFELVQTTHPECGGEGGPAEGEAGKGAQSVILVAEDSDFFREQVRRSIEGAGCKVLTAADGEAAWELLLAHMGEVQLVVTDIEMPRLNGLELTRRIRADQRFAELPVIAVTALAGEDDVAQGKAAGVTEYQVKLDRERLLASIRRHLEEQAAMSA